MSKDLFAAPSEKERQEADTAMFAPPSDAERKAIGDYLNTPTASPLDSFSAGAQQGLTFGHADELGAALGAGLEKAAGTPVGPEGFPLVPGAEPTKDKKLSDLYQEYLDASRKRIGNAESANPVAAGAGNLAGGALGIAAGSMALGPAEAATTLPEGAGAVGKMPMSISQYIKGKLPAIEQSAQTAVKYGAPAGAIAAEGNQEAPILSDQTLPNMAEGAGLGSLVAGAIPPAAELVGGAAKGTASALKGVKERGGELIENILSGDLGKTFSRGFGENGRSSREWLVGAKAQQAAGSKMLDVSEKLVAAPQKVLQETGQLKNDIINAAAEKGVRIPDAEVDDLINRNLGQDPLTTLDKTKKEMQKFRDMLLEARDGEEVEKVRRVFYGEGNSQLHKFESLMQQKQAAQKASETEGQPISQREAFESKVKQKEQEKKMVAGSQDATPWETVYEDNPGQPGTKIAMARQKQFDPNTGNFMGYKKMMSDIIEDEPQAQAAMEMVLQPHPTDPGKLIGVIRQQNPDGSYNIVSQKTLNAEEAAKFKDVSELVREKKFDLTNPQHLYQLNKDLKTKVDYAKNPWEMEQAFSSPEVQSAAKNTMQDINATLRQHIPDLEQVDQNIMRYNTALDQLPIEKGADPEEVRKKIATLILQSKDITPEAEHARRTLQNYFNKLKIADPQFAHTLESEMNDAAETISLTGAASEKAYLPRPLARPQSWAAKFGNVSGYTLGYMTPDMARNISAKLMTKGGQAASEVGRILSRVAEKDDRARNAVLFGLMQNPAYRNVLKDYMPDDSSISNPENQK